MTLSPSPPHPDLAALGRLIGFRPLEMNNKAAAIVHLHLAESQPGELAPPQTRREPQQQNRAVAGPAFRPRIKTRHDPPQLVHRERRLLTRSVALRPGGRSQQLANAIADRRGLARGLVR